MSVAMLSIALAGSACVPTAGRDPSRREPAPPLVWPAPPARARIRFVQTVASPADLGGTRSFWRRLGDLVAGAQEEWLIRPTGVVVRGSTIYVADPGAQALWAVDGQKRTFQKIQKAGRELLVSPVAVAAGGDGRVYVADSYLGKVFVYGADLTLSATIGDGDVQRPSGLAVHEASGRLYVADSKAHRVWVYAPDGSRVGAIGRRGTGEGEFNFPTHVAVDRSGTVYATDALGFRVQIFSGDGRILGQFGHPGDSSGDFARPKGVAVDSEGHVYVVEALFDAVQIFDRRGRFLLGFGERGLGPGQFWLPVGIFIDRADRIYVADSYNQRIQIFEYLAGGGHE